MPIGLNASMLAPAFEAAADYDQYLASDAEKAQRWRDADAAFALTDQQRTLLGGFTRSVRVLVLSGIWCGDCVRQGPVLQAIANAAPPVDLRWLDRDAAPGLMEQLRINDGARVPVVVFMAEDCEPVSVYGDRTLAQYRDMAAQLLGPACPVPGAPVDDAVMAGITAEWIDEFERVHLLLRLSGRLRQKHND